MEPKHDSASDKSLGSHTEFKHDDSELKNDGSNSSSELRRDAKHDDNETKIEGTISSLELHPKAKHDVNESKIEDTISGIELYPKAKHGDHESKIESTIPGLELHPEAKSDPTVEDILSSLELHPKAKPDVEEQTIEDNISGVSYSSSSSSSSTSSGSPRKFESGEEDLLDASFAKSETPQSPLSSLSSSPDVPSQTPQWSMISASPRSGTGNLSSMELLTPTAAGNTYPSPMKSPPIQTMGRPAGYDPNRIPLHIFSTKPTTPMEWSVASNESLFSIHMGNNSFRDHAMLMGDTKPEEWSSSPLHLNNVSEAKSNEPNNFTSNLPPVLEAVSENDKKNADKGDDSESDEESREPPKQIPAEPVQETDKEKGAPAAAQEGRLYTTSSNLSDARGVSPSEGTRPSVSASRVSNESANSSGSFAFPVLVGDAGKTVL